MTTQATHEEAVVPSDALTAVEEPADLSDAISVDDATAEKVLDVMDRRASVRPEERYDIILSLDGWAYESWSDYDIATEQLWLLGHVEDYSEKAYKVRGAFELDMDTIESRPFEEVHDEHVTELLSQVDETDEDFHERLGEAYVPKSAVEGLVVYDGGEDE